MTLFAKAGTLARSLRDPDLARDLVRTARTRWDSEHEAVGLRRDLDVPVPVPPAPVELRIRDYRTDDAPHILEADRALPAPEKADREVRRRLIAAALGTPLVAVGPDDVPVYLQWAFTTADDAAVRGYFGGVFPPIGPGTVLLENLFIPTAHRGRRLGGVGMVLVGEHVRDRFGAREMVTFVGVDNVASLKGVARAGFVPYTRRVQRWHRLRQTTTFTPLPVDAAT